jgi:hypothetical protein
VLAMNVDYQARGWSGAIPQDNENGAVGVNAQQSRQAQKPSQVSVNGNAVTYTLPRSGHICIGLYDTHGRCISKMLDATQGAGSHTATVDQANLPAGTYAVRIAGPSMSQTGRMTILRNK